MQVQRFRMVEAKLTRRSFRSHDGEMIGDSWHGSASVKDVAACRIR